MAWNNGISFRLPWYPSAKLFSDGLIPTTIHTSLLEGVCLTCFTLLYLSNSEVSAHQPVNPSNSRTRLLEDGVISIRLLRCYDLLYLAIWLYIHEIYIYIYTHIHSDMTFHHPFSSWSTITLPHQKGGLLAPFMIRSFTIWYPPGRQVFGKDRGFGICDPAVVAPSSVCNLRFVDPAKVNLWSKTKGWETIKAWKERVECWMMSYYALTGLNTGRSEGF